MRFGRLPSYLLRELAGCGTDLESRGLLLESRVGESQPPGDGEASVQRRHSGYVYDLVSEAIGFQQTTRLDSTTSDLTSSAYIGHTLCRRLRLAVCDDPPPNDRSRVKQSPTLSSGGGDFKLHTLGNTIVRSSPPLQTITPTDSNTSSRHTSDVHLPYSIPPLRKQRLPLSLRAPPSHHVWLRSRIVRYGVTCNPLITTLNNN